MYNVVWLVADNSWDIGPVDINKDDLLDGLSLGKEGERNHTYMRILASEHFRKVVSSLRVRGLQRVHVLTSGVNRMSAHARAINMQNKGMV